MVLRGRNGWCIVEGGYGGGGDVCGIEMVAYSGEWLWRRWCSGVEMGGIGWRVAMGEVAMFEG